MSNWSYNEDRLRRWTPRRVSPDLRQRIFGQPALAVSAARTISDLSRWLVPAFGCFLLVVGGLSERMSDRPGVGGETNFLGGQSGGNSRIMLAQGRQHSEINALPVTRMERNLGASQLAQPANPTFTSYTNKLIQQ